MDSVPPLIKEADLLIQIRLESVYELNVLFDESIRVADN